MMFDSKRFGAYVDLAGWALPLAVSWFDVRIDGRWKTLVTVRVLCLALGFELRFPQERYERDTLPPSRKARG